MKVLLRFFTILFLLINCTNQVLPVHAQTGSASLFSTPDVSAFPIIQFYLDVFDSQGAFAGNIQAANLQVIENGQVIPPDSVEMVENGLQIIVAINTSPDMATVTNGYSGYSRIQQVLQNWAANLPAQSLDDFSLSTPTGLYLIRARDPQEFVQAVADYQPDLQKNQVSLNSLSEALDLSTDAPGRSLLKRSILFITPPLPAPLVSSLPDLATRATEIGVRVSVWMIGKATNLSEEAPDPLREFAEATGGKYYQTASTENLPQVETAFIDLRNIYRVEYHSAVQASGNHTLQVKINSGSSNLVTDEIRFSLEVEPPNPIFLSPPAQIRRSWNPSSESQESQALTPDEVDLQIVVEFPDGRARALQNTRLFVDGKLISENTQQPFDRFTWSLTDITASTQKSLHVEVVDAFGLSGSSIEVPIEVIIDPPAEVRLVDRITDSGMIAIVGVAVSGLVLTLILVFTGTQRRASWKRQQSNKKLRKDPLTQPVQIQPVSPRKGRNFFQKKNAADGESTPLWPRTSVPAAPARLVALDENEQPITGGNMPLSRQEITFGSDPKRATQVLNSNTVDGLHARLYRTPEGEFFLADQNTIAGTWINYAPVTSSGARLEHGDLIHIGKVMFRFELTDLSQVPPVEIKVVELEQNHDPR